MGRSEDLATRLAICVERFRERGAKDEQKAAFRSLLNLVNQVGLYLREDEQGVRMNGDPVNALALGALTHRLALHNVSEIRVPPRAPPAEVFALLQALAESPGPAGDDVASRLETAGATHVRVTVGPPGPETSGERSADGPTDAAGLGTEGLLRGDPMRDIRSSAADVAGVSGFTYDPDPPAAEQALPAVGGARASDLVFGGRPDPGPVRPRAPAAADPIAPQTPVSAGEAPGPAPPPDRSANVAPTEGDRPRLTPTIPPTRANLLAALEREPAGPQVGDVLAAIGQIVADAARAHEFEVALDILAKLIDLEQRVPESARRQYGIAFRRMFAKGLLVGLGELLGTPGQQAAASIVLQRAGPDGVEVMLDRLVTVQGMAERRALFDALRHLREGRTQLIPMLSDPKWFVVRNVAELIGELGVEEAVPGLAQLLNHADERVRKAAALALAKIGTRAASEPLRRALRDPSPEVRVQVAMGVGGPRAQGLAMPLVVALDEEKDEAVQRELLLALGRIGTADAVQALLKVAQPAGRVFGRKPVALRLAAVDALRIAGTPPAIGALEGLKADGDREIGAAAQAALAELKKRQK